MTDVAVLAKATGRLVVEVITVPVRLLIDVTILVVQLRIQQHQPRQFVGTLGRVVGSQPAAEACPKQTDPTHARCLEQMSQCDADVVEVNSQSVVFLPTIAVTVATKVIAQAGHASISQSGRQTGKETAFLTRDPATVD